MDGASLAGTITLLFTDVEGSTTLLRELREGYADALAEHQRLLRRAFALHGGREVDTQGDAFFVVFDSAAQAVAAAADALRALAPTPIRVRVGLHTGEPQSADGRYVGLAVHRAARICAAANGGQIVMSQATRSVIGDGEPDGVMIRALGEHALKDFETDRLYQVIVDGVAADLRPVRTLEAQEAEPVHFDVESDLLAALDDVLGPEDPRATRQHRTVEARTALVRLVRRPVDLVLVGLLVLLGVLVTPWLFAVAAALAVAFAVRHLARERKRVADATGIHLYAMRALAPDAELEERIRQLGALLAKAAQLAHDADRFLAASDRRQLAQRLVAARDSAISAADARRVDELARAIELRDGISEHRARLAREIRRAEACSADIRAELFEIRLGHHSRNDVLDTLITLHANVEDAVAPLREELQRAGTPDMPRKRQRLLRRSGGRRWESTGAGEFDWQRRERTGRWRLG
jgi:class 3 adenylate cyclase